MREEVVNVNNTQKMWSERFDNKKKIEEALTTQELRTNVSVHIMLITYVIRYTLGVASVG